MNEPKPFKEVKLYLEDLLLLHQVPKNLAYLVYELLTHANKDYQVIINSFIKKELAEKTKLSKGTIDNALTKLTDAELLLRLDRGVYLPQISLLHSFDLQKGKAVTLTVTYQDQIKKMNTEQKGNVYDN